MTNVQTPVIIISNHGDVVGGGELSLLDFVKGLDRTRWDPHVVVPHAGEVSRRCECEGLKTSVVPLPSLRFPGLALVRSVTRLVGIIQRLGAKVLHANGSRAMFYAGLAGLWMRIPVVWHVRVADPEPIWDRVLGKMAALIIVNSKAVGRRFRGRIRQKVCCVYNGVDLTRFFPREPSRNLREQLGLKDGDPIVLSVGRFVPFKGYAHLLDAAKLVNATLPTVQWILVGEGDEKEALLQQAQRLGLERHVHFVGWQTDIPAYLSVCDVFVLPSLHEHFGRVVIEAMAMAKPVVATSAGGVPEIVDGPGTGLLVPPSRSEPLAEAIVSVLQDHVRAQHMGKAGRQRVEQQFSLPTHVLGVEALWRKTLGVLHGRV